MLKSEDESKKEYMDCSFCRRSRKEFGSGPFLHCFVCNGVVETTLSYYVTIVLVFVISIILGSVSRNLKFVPKKTERFNRKQVYCDNLWFLKNITVKKWMKKS